MKHVLAVLVLLFGTAIAHAQSCGIPVVRSYQGGYVRRNDYVVREVVVKKIVTPVAVPVLVPATVFQYLPALTPAYPVPGATPGMPPPQPAPSTPSSADIDRIVRERIEVILREKYGANDGPPPLILPGSPTDSTQSKETTQPAEQNVVQRVAQLLANNCASCHTTGKKTSGGVSLFRQENEQLVFAPSVSGRDILKQVTGTPPAMPPTAKTNPATALSSADVQLLQQWVLRP